MNVKKTLSAYTIALLLMLSCTMQAQMKKASSNGVLQRDYFVQTLTRIADPVLTALSKMELKKKMPVEAKANDRQNYTYLEACRRLLAGMAPWLELGADSSAEGKLRKKYIDLSLICIRNATDPASPDFMNFTRGGQPL